MRVLALTRFARLGASSRMRFFQYLPHLAKQGIDVKVSSLFSDDYVQFLQQRNYHNKGAAFRGLIGRIARLLDTNGFDLLWIEKEALPWMPVALESLLMARKQPFVLDYDDAVFHYYDQHRNPIIRLLLANKHNHIMRRAAMVIAGNPYIAERALAAGARNVQILPTVVDLARYPLSSHSRRDEGKKIIVGWIGQRHNAHYLKIIGDAAVRLHQEGKASFLAIGAGEAGTQCLPFQPVTWSEATETTEIARFDIGVMPLPDEPFERGKCGYKLIQYMASGIPVIASPVGINANIVEDGVNGFLARSPDDWCKALQTLVADADMRHRMGIAGREKVERIFSLQATAPKLATLLREAAESRPQNRAVDF